MTPTRPGRVGVAPGDVVAGVSVALVLIPQSVAYARLAGLPPEVGLYAAALPPIAAAIFASSPYLQTGPVAITSLLTFGALSVHATPGSHEYVAMGTLLALIVGCTRVAIGLLGMGGIAHLISEPVLRGFVVGAAVLIIASQLPGALGLSGSDAGVLTDALQAMLEPALWDPLAVAATVLTTLLVLGGARLHPLFPGVVVAGALGIAVSVMGGYAGPVIGSIPAGLPPLTLALPWAALPSLAAAGVVIAVVGFAETAAIGRAFATRERRPWDPNRELLGQGAANLAAGLTGGFPVGGSFSRSALNQRLGARTRLSGAVTGLAVLLFMPFAAFLAMLPIAVVSAIVIVAAVGLVSIRPILALWPLSRPQFAVSGATLALTLTLAPHIDRALLIGVAMSVAVHLWRELHLDVQHWTEPGEVLHLRPRGVLWFGSAETLKGRLLDLTAQHPEAKRLVIHTERLGRIDVTGGLAFQQVVDYTTSLGLKADFVGVDRQVGPVMERLPLNQLESSPPGTVDGSEALSQSHLPQPGRRPDVESSHSSIRCEGPAGEAGAQQIP